MSRPDLSGMQIYGTDSFKPSEPVYWNQIEMRHIFTMDLGYGTLKLYADRIPAKYDKKGNVIFEGEYYNDKRWNGKGYNKNNTIYEMRDGKGYLKEYNIFGGLIFEGEYTHG